MTRAEIPDTYLEPAPAVLPRVIGKFGRIDAQVINVACKRIVARRYALFIKLTSDAPHTNVLCLAPFRGLQRDIDSRRQ